MRMSPDNIQLMEELILDFQKDLDSAEPDEDSAGLQIRLDSLYINLRPLIKRARQVKRKK